MNKEAFSKDGYIINQPAVKDVTYGKLPACKNGCGYMAAYNLLRALGQTPTAEEMHDALEGGLTFGGRFGTGPNRLYRFIKTRHAAAKIAYTYCGILKNVKAAKGGIIMYLTHGGAHYAAFVRTDGDNFRFFNADHANENHTDTFEGFVKQWCKAIPAIICVITAE